MKSFFIAALSAAVFVVRAASAEPRIPDCADSLEVLDVGPESAASRAGIQPGDVLIGWRAGEEGTVHPFTSPFDVLRVEIEHAVGPDVVVMLRRGDGEVAAGMDKSLWRMVVAPATLAARDDAGLLNVDPALPSLSPCAVTWLHTHRAAVRLRSGDVNGAARELRDAMASASGLSGRERESALFYVGRAAIRLERMDIAEEALGAIRKDAGPRDDVAGLLWAAVVEERLGGIAVERGDGRRAMQRMSTAHALRVRVQPGSYPVMISCNNLARAAMTAQDFHAGRSWARMGLALAEELDADPLAFGAMYHLLASASFELGEHAAAERELRTALTHYEMANATSESATVWREIAAIASLQERFLDAGDAYERALALVDPMTVEHQMLRIHQSRLYETLGDFAGAVAAAEDAARRLAEIAPESAEHLDALRWLASAKQRGGDYAAARELRVRLADIWYSMGPGSKEEGDALVDLGSLAMDTADVAAAQMYFECAKSRYAGAASPPREVKLAMWTSRIDWLSARPEAALEGVSRAIATAATNARELLPELYIDRANLRAERDDLRGAAADVRSALEAVNEVAGDTTSFSWKAARTINYADTHRFLVSLLFDLGDFEAAADAMDGYRSRALHPFVNRAAPEGAGIDPALRRRLDELAAEHDRRAEALTSAVRTGDEVQRLTHEIVAIEIERDNLLGRVGRTAGTAPRFTPRRLPAGAVVLNYVVLRDRTLLLAASSDDGSSGIEAFVIPAGAEDLAERVRAFRTAIESPSRTLVATTRAGAGLYDLLVRPARAMLGAARTVAILPDGPLHDLPFSALTCGDCNDARYLIEQFPILMLPATSVLPAERRQAPALDFAGFGGVTNPQPGRPRGSRACTGGPLVFDVEELHAVARLFADRAAVFTSAGATAERVAASAGARYLHFATHGCADRQFPLASALMLSPSDAAPDGSLTARWIIERVSTNAEVAVLSACETGAGQYAEGEGILGLVRAFQIAGARSVVGTLWLANDAASREILPRFYRELRNGSDPAAALRAAQMQWLRRKPDPIDWAPYVAHGGALE